MKDSRLTISCYPTRGSYTSGEPVLLRVELENKTASKMEILSAGVPWMFHHAIKFNVLKGVKKGTIFDNRLWVIEPPSTPGITIETGKTASGTVDLARYLYSKDDRSISQVPGTYQIHAHLLTFISVKGNDEKFQKVEVDSEPFNVVIQ